MGLNIKYTGYTYLLLFLMLESFFPILSFFALKEIPTIFLINLSILISILFGIIVILKEKLYKCYYKKDILKPVFLSALFLGIGGAGYFYGIKYSSPSVAAILLLLQTFFAFIIFNLLGKESYNFKQIIGACLMFLGAGTVIYDGSSFYNIGSIIMVISTLLMTIGNFYTKIATKKGVNSFFILFNRNILMFVLTLIIILFTGVGVSAEVLSNNIIWIFLIGFLVMFLSKIMWINALGKLHSFTAISMFPLIPVFVVILSFFILKDVPTLKEILGFIPIFIGSIMLIYKTN